MTKGNESFAEAKARFLRKCTDHTSGCLIYNGKPSTSGYGTFRSNLVQDYAHRWAWYFYKKVWPDKFVCHTCDNGMCVKEEHLFLGTHADNMKDASAKHRMGRPHTLSAETRDKIKEECLTSGKSQRRIAYEYCISQATVSEISRGLHQHIGRKQDTKQENC